MAPLPQVDFPTIQITTTWSGASAETMATSVAAPLEQQFGQIAGITQMTSQSSLGASTIVIQFDLERNIDSAAQDVQAAITVAAKTLPQALTTPPAYKKVNPADVPVLLLSVHSDTVPLINVDEYANVFLAQQISQVNGVAQVSVFGDRTPSIRVQVDPAKLASSGITLEDIRGTLINSTTNAAKGVINTDKITFTIAANDQITNADQYNDIVLAYRNGAPVRVRDVGQAVADQVDRTVAGYQNNRDGVILAVFKQPGANVIDTVDKIMAQLPRIRASMPPSIDIGVLSDRTQTIRASVHDVQFTLLLTIILVVMVIFVFLRNVPATIIPSISIPLSLVGTLIVMLALGYSINLLTLLALVLGIGLVVDDAIVVVENIVLHREAGENRIEAVRKALAEITHPLIGSTITPIVVFLPLIAVTGVTGTFFRALALTMTVALLTSLALALTWTPALSLTLLRSHHRHSEQIIPIKPTLEPAPAAVSAHRLMEPVLRIHERILRAALAKPLWLAGACALLIVTVFVAYQGLGSDLLPEMDEGAFVLDYIMPAGSSLQETNRVLLHVDRILHHIPEVTTTSRRTGLQMGLAAVTEANTGDFTVLLSNKRSRAIDDIMEDARQQIHAAEPELDIEFTQVLQDMIGDLSNAPEPIQIKLFSTNQDLLNQLGPRVGDAIAKIPGVVDVENGIENTISGPATNFQVDPAIAARYGFTTAEVATDATSILDGLPTPQPLIENGRPYTVRVRLDDSHRASLDAIENTVFLSSTGKMATLGALAHIEQLPPQNEILRENLQQLVTVTGRLEGSDLGSAIARVQKTVADLHLPSSVRVQYGGTYQEQQQSFHQLLQVLLFALVLVYGVLLAEFRNFSAPISVLVSSILSTAGVIFALLITGTTFNVASFMGLIMVIGIVAKNGILLLDADQRFRLAGMSPRDAMIQAARRRLRPIVMTALAAITGMLPLALALGSGSQMLQPLAIAVIGGLLISMALSLIVTPAVYYYLARE